MNHFSVLMSVYHKENPEYIRQAFSSIWDHQILKPNEIVIVKDGPLTIELDDEILFFSQRAPVKIVKLEENKGLGIALNIGLNNCINELVARMDSDDISHPERFEKQINYLINNPEISFVSSNIQEFGKNISDILSQRLVPEFHQGITSFSKLRNPMNHMAIVFKKQAVLSSGGYIPFLGYEDYYLWVRMLQKGYKAYNIQENLVHARTGNNMLARRQGYVFFKQELKLQVELKRLKHINSVQLFRNIILRALPRLFPIFGLKMVYNFLRKKND